MKKDNVKKLDTKAKVKVENIFHNLIASKQLDLSKFKFIGKNYEKTFESGVPTTLNGITLFPKDSINYLNIQLTEILSYLLKNLCKDYLFNVTGIWINKYKKNDYQASHVHPSHFSFIIYYKVDKSYTMFNSPVKSLLESLTNNIFHTEYNPNLKQGDIIVFPSYLEHWVRPNSNNITVSGNIEVTLLNNR
tara:strand:- start:254 stop:826 length:573 start_codon:yes stop_codon:yes gene_type:complete